MHARTTRFSLLVAIFAVAVALLVPASASAHATTPGWTTFYGQPQTFDPCSAQLIYPPQSCPRFTGNYSAVTAWQWNAASRSWSKQTLAPHTTVYQYPYTGDWVWVWSSQQGWLATEHKYLHPSYATIGLR